MVCIDWWKNFPVGLGVCLVVESSASMHAALGVVLSPMKCKVKSNKLCAQDAFHVSMCVLTHVQAQASRQIRKQPKVFNGILALARISCVNLMDFLNLSEFYFLI